MPAHVFAINRPELTPVQVRAFLINPYSVKMTIRHTIFTTSYAVWRRDSSSFWDEICIELGPEVIGKWFGEIPIPSEHLMRQVNSSVGKFESGFLRLEMYGLIKRRTRQGTWLYVILALGYSFLALFCVEEVRFHSGIPAAHLWPLALPLMIIVSHIVYPTVLIWAFIFFPTVIYSFVGLYYLIGNAIHAQWEYDASGFILGITVMIALACICYGLYHYRPFKPSTPHRGGSVQQANASGP